MTQPADTLSSRASRPFRRFGVGPRTLLAGWVAGCLMFVSGQAIAQTLPPGVSNAPSLAPAQIKQVQEFAQANLAKLKGTSISERETARDELVGALDAAGISLSFRLAMSNALVPELLRLAPAPDDHTAVNSLRVAQSIGTPQAADVLKSGLEDKRPAVRIASARGLRESIRHAATAAQTPINQAKIEDLIEKLARALSTEASAPTAKSLVLALDAARAGAPTGPMAAVHGKGLELMADALASRAKAARGQKDPAVLAEWTDTLVTGLDALRRTYIDPQRISIAAQPGMKKAAGNLCGQSIAYLRARVSAGPVGSAPDSALLKTIANAAEAVLLLIEGGDRPQKLAGAFSASAESGNAKSLVDAADEWIGTGGRLTKPPFTLSAKDFSGN